MTNQARAEIQRLVEAIQAVINDAAGGELEGDYAGCVAVSMDLMGTMEDALSALIAEGPSLCKCGARQEEHGPEGIWHDFQPAAPRSAPATAEEPTGD